MSLKPVHDDQISAQTATKNVKRLVTTLLGTIDHGWWRFLLAVFLSVCATASSVALMGVSAWLLSRAAEMPPVMYLTVGAVGVRFFGIARGVFRYLERLVAHDLALRMQAALRFRVYQKLSASTLLGRRRGDLLVRVTADVEGIMDIIVRVVLPFTSAIIVLLGTCALLAMFSPLFAIVLLALSLISGIVLPWIGQRWTKKADQNAAPARGEMGNRVREIAVTAPDLVAYGLADQALAKVNESDAKLTDAEAKGAWTQGVIGGIQMVFTGLTVAAALVIGAYEVASGRMLARNLAVLVLVPMALYETFQDLTKAAQTLTHAKASLTRVLNILESPDVGIGDRQISDDNRPKALVLTDVSIGWPGAQTLLSGIDLRLEPGEKVAITGSSGLGKTTLAATIMGLIEPKSGQIQAPSNISYLSQNAHIFATTLAENVRIGNKNASDEQVTDALKRAGLDLDPNREVGESGATLSGGEAQRVALARILVRDTPSPLVILDEPTEHLDQDTADLLLDDLFRELADSSLLVITHDHDLADRCDRRVDLEQYAIHKNKYR